MPGARLLTTVAALLGACVLSAGCARGEDTGETAVSETDGTGAGASTGGRTSTGTGGPSTGTGGPASVPSSAPVAVGAPALRDELLAMMETDQADRTGGVPAAEWDDVSRTARLAAIIDEHGWPTWDLVGVDGGTAAWLIAQHADQDVAFQERALGLLREAVAAQQADPTELAYLEDRVALNRGGPQTYGTQIGCVDGRAVPAEMVDPDTVDERRAAAGLSPLAAYLAELQPACEEEAPAAGTTSKG